MVKLNREFTKSLMPFVFGVCGSSLVGIGYAFMYYVYLSDMEQVFQFIFMGIWGSYLLIWRLVLHVLLMQGFLVLASLVFSWGLVQGLFHLRVVISGNVLRDSSWYGRRGGAITRFTADVDSLGDSFRLVFQSIVSLAQVSVPLFVFVRYALDYGVLFVVFPVLYVMFGFVGSFWFSSYSKRVEREIQEAYDEIQGLLQAMVRFSLEVRVLNPQVFDDDFTRLLDRRNRLSLRIALLKGLYSPVIVGYFLLGLSLSAFSLFFMNSLELMLGYSIFFISFVSSIGPFFGRLFVQVYKFRALVPRIEEVFKQERTGGNEIVRFIDTVHVMNSGGRFRLKIMNDVVGRGPGILSVMDQVTFPCEGVTMFVLPPLSGKTRLARFLSGLSNEEGIMVQKCFGGEDCVNLPLHVRALYSQYVSGDDAVFAGSVRDNVLLGGDQVEQVEQVFNVLRVDFVEVNDVVNGKRLSGGQKRRLSLARGLLSESRFVFIDEPFRGLDETLSHDVLDGLVQLSSDRGIVLFSSSLLFHPDVYYVILRDDHLISGYGRDLMIGGDQVVLTSEVKT